MIIHIELNSESRKLEINKYSVQQPRKFLISMNQVVPSFYINRKDLHALMHKKGYWLFF